MRKLLFFMLTLIFTAASAWAQDYYVATDGSDSNDGSEGSPWLTIQHAINEVPEGATINVAAGAYVEEGQIVVAKDLSIIGEDKNTTTIKPAQNTASTGDARGWILVEAGNEFNLSNVTLDGAGKDIFQAIRSFGTGTIDNNIITNMEYPGYHGTGIVVMGNMTVSNNYINNQIGRIGIHVFDMSLFLGGSAAADNVIVTGNTYVGKGSGDFLQYAIEVGGGAKATITHNNISNCGESETDWASAGILVTSAHGEGISEAIIENNHIFDNRLGVYVGYNDTDASKVVANNNTFEDNYFQFRRRIGTDVDLDAVLANNNFDRATVIRDAPGGDFTRINIYGSIGAAIHFANDGEAVEVSPGTYVEAVEINVPNLTLKSTEGRDVTIIDNPNVGSETAGVKVAEDMGTVTVEGFTVNNFRNGIIQGYDNPLGTAFIVKNNKVIPENENYMRNGIQISGDGSKAIGNYIVGASLTPEWSGSAINVVDAKNALVKNNVINTASADIGVIVLNHNNVDVQDITIENNRITGANNGIRLDGYHSATSYYAIQNITITGNEIKDGDRGINAQWVKLSNITITENIIKDNERAGIRFSPATAEVIEGVSVNNNSIVGNNPSVELGVGSVNATCNWWGTTVEADIQSKIAEGDGSVDVSTILLNNILDPNDDDYFCGAPIDKPVQNMNTLVTYETIQAAINAALPGHVIQVAPGTYNEALTIGKALTLKGPNAGISAGVNAGNRGQEAVIVAPGVSVAVFVNQPNIGNVTIDGFKVADSGAWTHAGIAQESTAREGTTVHFLNNIVMAPETVDAHGNPIQVTGDGSTVIGNQVQATELTNEDWSATGILVIHASGVLVQDNLVIGHIPSENGICIQSHGSFPQNNVIKDNKVITTKRGIYLSAWNGNVGATEITNNILKDNTTGVRFTDFGQDNTIDITSMSGNVFENNEIQVSHYTELTGIDLDPILANNTFDRSVVVRGSAIQVPAIFSSIQDAIDEADEGNTIEVGPGTYNEALEIYTDDLTLVSTDGAENTIIDAGGATNAIKIGEYDKDGTHPSDVTIDGFTVKGWQERGIGQRNGNEKITVLNNIVIAPEEGDNIRGGIILSGGDGSKVKGNTVAIPEFGTEGWSSAGIMLMGTLNAIVEENTVNGLSTAEVGIGVFGYPEWDHLDPNWVEANGNIIRKNIVFECGNAGIGIIGNAKNTIIEENEIFENFVGVWAYDQKGGTPSDNELELNKIYDNDWNVGNSSIDKLLATCNWFGTDVFSQIAAKIFGDVTWSPYLQTAQGPCGGFAPVANVTQGTYFTSIGAAVEAAAANNVIEVSEGTYNETFTIDVENLTLRAKAGQAVTIDGENTGNVVEITANGVTLKGFTVINGKHPSGEGPGKDGSGEIKAGIKLDGADGAKLLENTIENSWYGIWLTEATNSEIIDNTIYDSATIGIALVESSTGNIVKENTIINTGIEHEGVPVVQGQRGLGAGIRIEADNNTIHDNIIQDNDGDGIRIQPVVTPENTIQDLVITENLIHKNNQHGIRLGAGNNITITGNTITENGESEPGVRPHQRSGLYVYQSGATGDFGTHTVRNNIFSGNLPYGVNVGHDHGAHNVGDILLDVKRNYWGADNGPSTDDGFFENYSGTHLPEDEHGNPLFSDADGDGDAVSIDVVFGPWWMNEAMTELSSVTADVGDDDVEFDGTGATLGGGGNNNFTVQYFNEKPDDEIRKSSNRGFFGSDYVDLLTGFWHIETSIETLTFNVTLDSDQAAGVKNINRLFLIQREYDTVEEEAGDVTGVYKPEDATIIDGTKLKWQVTQAPGTYQYIFANGEQVDISINRVSCNEYEVVISPNADINAAQQISTQFTVKWPETDAPDVEFTNIDATVFDFTSFDPESGDIFVGNYTSTFDDSVYWTFFAEAEVPTGITINAGDIYPLVMLTHDQSGSGDGSFMIMLDDDGYVGTPPNELSTKYNVEVWGKDVTGIYDPEMENVLPATDVPFGLCPLTIGGSFIAEDKPYDGNKDATVDDVGNLTLVTVIGTDVVSLTSLTFKFANKDAGTWDVSITDADLDGADAGKYDLDFETDAPTTTATIEARTLTITITGNPTKPYDGNTDATLVSGDYTVEGLVGSEMITVTQTEGTYDTKDVGIEINVTANLTNPDDFNTSGGALLGNYVLPATAEGDGTITSIPLIITADPQEKLYDNAVFPIGDFTVSYDGFVGGEDEDDLAGTLTFTGTAVTAKAVGTYVITPEGLTSNNYDIDFQDGTLEIKPITFALRAFLQGSFDNGGMKSTLRTANQLPADQPYNTTPWNYAGAETSTLPPDAADWVLVEFRDTDDANYEVKGRAAGMLRTTTGNLSVTIDDVAWPDLVNEGDYFVVIYHRNHLPVMSKEEVEAPVTTRFDMSDPGNLLAGSFRDANGTALLAAGDVTASGRLAYTGPGNDRGPILFKIYQENDFSGNITDDIENVYFPEDVNLDNKVLYSGSGNDRLIILQNIQYFTQSNLLMARYTSPVPGAFNTGKDQYFNNGPVNILVDGDAVIIYTDKGIAGGLVDNIQFTLGWKTNDAEAAQAINNFASAFGLKPQGETVEVNGESFLAFVSVANLELPHFWSKDQHVSVMDFDADMTGRIWVANNDVAMNNNALYYISIWGEDNTGQIKDAELPTDIDEIAHDYSNFNVYPNPVSQNTITLVVPDLQGQRVDVAIYNLQGRLMKHVGETVDNTELTINLGSLPGGIYFIRAANDKMQYNARFVVLD